MARFLKIRGSHSVWFFVGFRIFGFLWFESRSRFVDHGVVHSTGLMRLDAREKHYGAYPWPEFFPFMGHMLVGLFVGFGIFGIPRFESSVRRVYQGDHPIAGQPYLGPSRGHHG